MKYEKEFPLFKTKVAGVTQTFDLSDIEDRKKYFEAKAGKEIAALKNYLKDKTFIVYFLGKKNAGKGTYAKLLAEVLGKDNIGHISVGDVVRATHTAMEDPKQKEEILTYLKEHYRGFMSIDEAIDTLMGRSTSSLLPTEFTLALVKREIDKMPRKALLIDGFPRTSDQVSYSLYFRDLVNYRSDPDVFVAISIPNVVIDERIRYRVVCPICKVPRNLKLLATKKVSHDKDSDTFSLHCDDPNCPEPGSKMVGKEGDELGIESIKERLETDDKLIDEVFTKLHGIPKILLRNAVPTELVKEYVDDYEITPAYSYTVDKETGEVETHEGSWTAKDEEGIEIYSLLPPAVALSFIKQLPKALGIKVE